ncbi:MAG: hypothetical protein AAGL29_13210 [Bacteroidota bacterium]
MTRFSILIAAMLAFGTLSAQQKTAQIGTGDTLIIKQVSASGYDHILIPKKNLIIKKGGIPDMKRLNGTRVIVANVENQNGYQVQLKRADGGRFFNAYRLLAADAYEALQAGELVPIQ